MSSRRRYDRNDLDGRDDVEAEVVEVASTVEPELKHLLDKRVYKNRRNMAYFSLFMITVLFTLTFFWIPIEALEVYSTPISWFLGTFAAVVLGYMGSTVIPQFAISKNQHNNNRLG